MQTKKVIIITGASSGIGKALAEIYINKSWSVVIAARRIALLKKLENKYQNENVLSIQTDVTNQEQCKNLISKTVEKFGRINVLINCAGISMRALFKDVEMDVLHQVMDVNFWGTVYCSKHALPYLLKTKGSLVGIISVGGYIALPGRTGYSASKFAVRGFLDTVRSENRKLGLHVLVAAPGFTASNIRNTALLKDGLTQQKTPRDELKMMSAEKCANHIYKAVKKRKRSIVLTFVQGKLAVFLSKWAPKFVEKYTYKAFAKEPNSPFK